MRLMLACALLAALLALPNSAHATETRSPVEVVLLIGQSSMVGQDLTAPALPTDPRVWYWSGARGGTWWWYAREPLHQEGYGPGADFGMHLVTIRSSVHAVMLVPCAVNGADTERWVPGGDLYQRCVALADAGGLHPTGALVYQGGSDGATLAKANAWAGHMTSMVDGFRDEYGGTFLVVYARLDATAGSYASSFPYWAEIRAAQAGLSLPGVAHVETEDLARMPDGLHLNWPSALTLGQRMARAYAGLMP